MGWFKHDPRDDLIWAFTWALKIRPDDFTATVYVLTDTRTRIEWWIANEGYGFKCFPLGYDRVSEGTIEFTYSQGKRAWRAYSRWRDTRNDRATRGQITGITESIVEANDASLGHPL